MSATMIADLIFEVLFHPFAMLWYGQGLHLMKNLRDLERAGTMMTVRAYMLKYPYSMAFSVLAGLVAYGFLYSSGQLNVAAAFTAGYMADSVVNAFTGRAVRAIQETP